MVRPMGYFSKRGERISAFFHREVFSLEDEPRERLVLQGINSLFVCVPLKKNGRKGAKFKDRTISWLLQSACSFKKLLCFSKVTASVSS